MKITQILHVSVNVEGDLAANDRFYSEVLGLPVAPRADIPGVGGTWYETTNSQIHLVDAPVAGSGIDPTGPHFCLGVDDLEGALTDLDRHGVPYLRIGHQVWCNDPAGNTVELQEDPRG